MTEQNEKIKADKNNDTHSTTVYEEAKPALEKKEACLKCNGNCKNKNERINETSHKNDIDF